MGKLADFLTGTQVLEEVISPINGKITVIRSLAFGTYISVGGLTQSGGVLKNIWRKSLRQIQRTNNRAQRCLILGLGGGTAAKLVSELWPASQRGEPSSKITGVDLDPKMVEMGKKYLGLDDDAINVVIGDAYDFLTDHRPLTTDHFDLILVDLYVGDEFPKKFESENFLRSSRSILAEGGFVVFNRLYSGDKRSSAVKFGNKLEKIFKKVEVVYPEANVVFVCYN